MQRRRAERAAQLGTTGEGPPAEAKTEDEGRERGAQEGQEKQGKDMLVVLRGERSHSFALGGPPLQAVCKRDGHLPANTLVLVAANVPSPICNQAVAQPNAERRSGVKHERRANRRKRKAQHR